jgi:UDP-GlcNAc:undecaprenyl-phosphate/decaprenyl-phosphate GlcNAc-1-phosphate transferase
MSLIGSAVAASLLACLVTLTVIPFLVSKASSWCLVDHPGGRKLHDRSTPVVGGIGIALGIGTGVLSLLAAGPFMGLPVTSFSDGPFLATLMGGALVLLFVGILDDRKGLAAAPKLAIQLVTVLPFVVIFDLTLLPDLLPGWAASAGAIIWLLAIVNAFNLLDGMDGLMGSVALLCALALAALAWSWDVTDSLFVLAILVGALGGFLRWNVPIASTFAGDGGSLVVGYLLGAESLRLTVGGSLAVPGTAHHIVLAVLLILAIPIYDLCSVIWVRVRERRRVFLGDTSHLVHRLLQRGLSPTQALAFMCGCTILTTMAGILLAHLGLAAAPAVLTQCVVAVGLVALMEARPRLLPLQTTLGKEGLDHSVPSVVPRVRRTTTGIDGESAEKTRLQALGSEHREERLG